MNAEFERWRDAPAEQQELIARSQVLHLDLTVFVPALQRDPGEATWPNGRRGVDCKRQDFADMLAWLKALRDAGHALCAATDLRATVGGFKNLN
jgi:uncharacterized protein YbjT (DUF2867 family)